MENNNIKHVNRVYLTGNVGYCKITEVGTMRVARFGLATNEAYKARNGEMVEETTRHNITYWENTREGNLPLEAITKGQALSVRGKLRVNKYTGSDGQERTFVEVVAFDVAPAVPASEDGAHKTSEAAPEVDIDDLPF